MLNYLINNKKRGLRVVFTILALFFTFSKYLTPDTPIGDTEYWYSTFFFLTGIFLFNASGWIMDFINIKKWNKFDLYCSGLTMYLSIALVLQLIPYWIRTINGVTVGFLLMDLLTGLAYSIGVTVAIIFLKIKIIPRQEDVQKFIWINTILADGMNDKVLNPCYLMKHKCYKILQENKDNTKLRKDIFFLLDKLDEQHQITVRLLKMHHMAKDE